MSTQRDLVKNLSKKLDYLDSEDIKHAVNYILNYLKEELSKGNRVEIRGFGSMSIRKRKYASRDEYYNIVYYRMSKNVRFILNT
jgi:nucleoid DNA-binding protein